MASRPAQSQASPPTGRQPIPDATPTRFFLAALGAFIGLALVKFGNPVVLDRLIEPPRGALELVFQPWPATWGYVCLAIVVVIGLAGRVIRFDRWQTLLWLPMAWLGWQLLSAPGSIEPQLTWPTLWHFSACAICFYVGAFGLARADIRSSAFWIGIVAGFVYALWSGIDQRYGGLAAVRNMVYSTPDWQGRFPPEYLVKIQSNRIFGTLVYPNALAGAVLLFTPATLIMTWRMTARFGRVGRLAATGILAYMAAACLFWSGSKSGWLIALALIVVVFLLQAPSSRKTKIGVAAVLLVVGVAAFGIRFAPYFKKGATSVSARFDYWQAAVTTARENPVLGSGPGTFGTAYRRIKPPEAEMARLTHNDYLEQASDSGIPGALAYVALIVAGVGSLYRKSRGANPVILAVWLGVAGWALQGFVEFGLYIPALAWPVFLFLGWGCAPAEDALKDIPSCN